jgi:hypothetical protein
VELKSQAGSECRLRNPWGISNIDIYADSRKIKTLGGDLITFKTKINGKYTLVRKGITIL